MAQNADGQVGMTSAGAPAGMHTGPKQSDTGPAKQSGPDSSHSGTGNQAHRDQASRTKSATDPNLRDTSSRGFYPAGPVLGYDAQGRAITRPEDLPVGQRPVDQGSIDRPLATFLARGKDGSIVKVDERTFDADSHTRIKDTDDPGIAAADVEPYDVAQYDNIPTIQLRAELAKRELDPAGPREILIPRLRDNDEFLSEKFDGRGLPRGTVTETSLRIDMQAEAHRRDSLDDAQRKRLPSNARLLSGDQRRPALTQDQHEELAKEVERKELSSAQVRQRSGAAPATGDPAAVTAIAAKKAEESAKALQAATPKAGTASSRRTVSMDPDSLTEKEAQHVRVSQQPVTSDVKAAKAESKAAKKAAKAKK